MRSTSSLYLKILSGTVICLTLWCSYLYISRHVATAARQQAATEPANQANAAETAPPVSELDRAVQVLADFQSEPVEPPDPDTTEIGRNIFTVTQPPHPKPLSAAPIVIKEAESKPLAPPPPPPPFVYVGQVSDSGGEDAHVILLKGQDQFSARIGELLEGRWRIVNVTSDYVELEDQQLGSRHFIKKGETPAPPAKVNQAPVVSQAAESSGAGQSALPNLLARPARPMTRAELLQKRAEIMKEKRK